MTGRRRPPRMAAGSCPPTPTASNAAPPEPKSAQFPRYDDPRELCSVLAHAANLGSGTPRELVAAFDWAHVPHDDRVARFDGALVIT